MKNRKLLLIASLVLALTLSLSGTLAYLTDTDSQVNVMTLGNVKIEQLEMQRAEGVAHNAGESGKGNGVKEGALVPFKQGQALYPAFPVDGTAYTAEATDLFFWGDYVYSGTAANGLWNDEKLKGAMDKFVFVKNTGASDCYFRTWIAFECPEEMAYSEGSDKEFMMNVSGSNLYKWEDLGFATIGGVRYLVMCATYQDALAAGNTAHPSLLQVVMTHNATNEDMELLGNTYEILTLTQACQTVNFENANQALTAAFGAPELANLPWEKSPVEQLPITDSSSYLTDAEVADLVDKLENGGTIVVEPSSEMLIKVDEDTTFDGNGSTIVANGKGTKPGSSYDYGYVAFIGGKDKTVAVNDLTVTGAGFVELGDYGVKGGNYSAENLNVKNMTATYAVIDNGQKVAAAFGQYGTATLNNCVMTGTTTEKEGFTAYDAGFPNQTKTTINGGEYGKIYLWAQAKVEIYGAEVDTIYSRAISTNKLGKLVIGAGTHVGTIIVDPSAGYPFTLTIEDGAIVDAIVYNGQTYTQEAWMNR